MTSLKKRSLPGAEGLDQARFFSSLLSLGRQSGLLPEETARRIQLELLSLLTDQAKKYTRGESGSIQGERAEALLESIAFILSAALKEYPDPESALIALREQPLSQLFQAGLEAIQKKTRSARLLHHYLKQNLFQTRNVFYRGTLVDGIDGFFRRYNSQFAAQETHITADYPLFLPIKGLRGIEFIGEYLRRASQENRFCLYFAPGRVHRLLCGLDANYQQMPINIFSFVFNAALGCVLCDAPLPALACDRGRIYALLRGKTTEETLALLRPALDTLCQRLACPAGLAGYLQICLPQTARLLSRAAALGSLDACLLSPPTEEAPRIDITDGERLDGPAYAHLLSRLEHCESDDEKAALLLHEAHALSDLMELVRDAGFSPAACAALTATLPPEPLAALRAQYPCGDFLSDPAERALCAALEARLAVLPAGERQRVERAARAVCFSV